MNKKMRKGVFCYLAKWTKKRSWRNRKNFVEPNSRRDYILSNFPEKKLESIIEV